MYEDLYLDLLNEENKVLKFNKIKSFKNLYHYTSAESITNILRPEEVVLWASRIDCMNDKKEWEHTQDLYDSICNDLHEKNILKDNVYSSICSLKASNNKLFSVSNSKDDKKNIYQNEECQKFICCFSMDSDSLPMWNYYSNNISKVGTGYNIGLNSYYIEDNLESKSEKACLAKVVYNDDEKKKMIEKYILKISSKEIDDKELENCCKLIPNFLANCAMIFKSNCFNYENEARLIIDIPKSEIKNRVKYRVKNGMFIPYIELKFNPIVLKSVKIGPLSCAKGDEILQKGIIKEMITNMGYKNFDVSNSDVPIRY